MTCYKRVYYADIVVLSIMAQLMNNSPILLYLFPVDALALQQMNICVACVAEECQSASCQKIFSGRNSYYSGNVTAMSNYDALSQ